MAGAQHPPGHRIPHNIPNIPKGSPEAVAQQIWNSWVDKYAPGMTLEQLRLEARGSRKWHPEQRMREADLIFHLKARDAVMALADALEAAAIENLNLKAQLEQQALA